MFLAQLTCSTTYVTLNESDTSVALNESDASELIT